MSLRNVNCTQIIDYTEALVEGQDPQMMLRVNGLIVVNAILAGILVGIGAYGPRYRHHYLVGFLFQGATTLFVPIFSYVVSNGLTTASTLRRGLRKFNTGYGASIVCSTENHMLLVLLWAGLVQTVGISTCAVVAADDREGRNIGLPLVLLAQAVWTSYLAFNIVLTGDTSYLAFNVVQTGDPLITLRLLRDLLLVAVFPLLFGRIALKYYAFQMARRSFELGRNPRLIIGYMEHLPEESHHVRPTVGHLPSPPLIVMGEERQQVEKQPQGYCFKQMPNQDGIALVNKNSLVTIDKVWRVDDVLLRSIPEIKDICFSFALFKMLRCRFAGYTVAKAGFMKTYNLFWHVLLKDNDVGRVLKDSDSEKLPKNSDAERVFRVLENELSFLHDYYYSSLPISYSKSGLVISSIVTSLLTIIYCLLVGLYLIVLGGLQHPGAGQIYCSYYCSESEAAFFSIGNILFDLVPVILLLVLVVLAEIKDIVSYICSNWTKVALICRYVASHDMLQQSPRIARWISRVLRCRCKLTKHWDDKMNQCSVLLLHPRKPVLSSIMFDQKEKVKVKVPTLVKATIIDTLIRSSSGIEFSGVAFLQRSLLQDCSDFPWDDCSGRGTADTILIWHIITSILEVRHPDPRSPASENCKIVATHLSRYCAYLVAYVPELLPDDDRWCKSLYKAVKKDITVRVLAGGRVAAADEYEQVVALLSERSEHEVVKKGVRVGKRLAEWTEGREETAWRVLAGFWSEMLLSVAPSENLNGHADAVARGGELVTLVWALLMHAGPRTAAAASADAVDGVV